jgi:hypothetical protein
MKTFGLFMLLWLVTMLISFNIWREASTEEMLKVVLATQLAYIYYKLIKEDANE